jgi:hypothetical protein
MFRLSVQNPIKDHSRYKKMSLRGLSFLRCWLVCFLLPESFLNENEKCESKKFFYKQFFARQKEEPVKRRKQTPFKKMSVEKKKEKRNLSNGLENYF